MTGTARRLLWVALNAAAAVLVPLAFAWWLGREVRRGDALPDDFSPDMVVFFVTVGWFLFLLLLNVSLGLFLWLRRQS